MEAIGKVLCWNKVSVKRGGKSESAWLKKAGKGAEPDPLDILSHFPFIIDDRTLG